MKITKMLKGGTCLECLILNSENYKSWNINLNKKNLIVDGVQLIENGKKTISIKSMNGGELRKYGIEDCISNPYDTLDVLYEIYKKSIPNTKRKEWFRGKKLNELTDEERINSINRHQAQAMLDGYVLLAGLDGLIKFDGFFYQSKKDKEFVILRKWVTEC